MDHLNLSSSEYDDKYNEMLKYETQNITNHDLKAKRNGGRCKIELRLNKSRQKFENDLKNIKDSRVKPNKNDNDYHKPRATKDINKYESQFQNERVTLKIPKKSLWYLRKFFSYLQQIKNASNTRRSITLKPNLQLSGYPTIHILKNSTKPYKFQYSLQNYKQQLHSTPLLYKLTQYFCHDLISILQFLLILILLLLPHPIYAGCRDETSRSCEAICRPSWLKADNHNHYDAMQNLYHKVINTASGNAPTNNDDDDDDDSDNGFNDTLTVFSSSASRPLPSLIAYNCTVRALVLLPDNDMYLTSLHSVVPILKVAEQHVHESGLLPPYIRFDWMTQDDKCDAAFAVVKAMDGIVKECAHVIFGPTCEYSLAAVGRIAKYFNSNGTPLITIGGSTFDFEKPKTACEDEFYMMLRTGTLSFETLSELTITVMKRHKWSRSIFFYDRNGQQNVAGLHTCFLMMNSLGKQMRNENMTFAQYPITAETHNRTEEMIREIGNKHGESSDDAKIAEIVDIDSDCPPHDLVSGVRMAISWLKNNKDN